MLDDVFFISILSEGLVTVIPLQQDEIEFIYESADLYLQENFINYTTALRLTSEEKCMDVINHEGTILYSLEFTDTHVKFAMSEALLDDVDATTSLMGIIMQMSTYLIVRLGDLVFNIDETFIPAIRDESVEEDLLQHEDIDIEDSDKEEESSFDDDWI